MWFKGFTRQSDTVSHRWLMKGAFHTVRAPVYWPCSFFLCLSFGFLPFQAGDGVQRLHQKSRAGGPAVVPEGEFCAAADVDARCPPVYARSVDTASLHLSLGQQHLLH